jgi:hypothetical protein
VDLIKEAAIIGGGSGNKIAKSEVLKKHLFQGIAISAEIDADIKKQLVEAIKGIPAGRWEDRAFYEIEGLVQDKSSVEEPLAAPQAAPSKVPEATQ